MTQSPKRYSIDPDAPNDDRLAFAYDRDSDTLMVQLRGRGRAAVSVEAGDRAYVRWDRAAGEVIGLHLENFLRGIVPRHPELLDHTATYGVEPDAAGDRNGTAASVASKRAALLALAPLFDQPVVAARRP